MKKRRIIDDGIIIFDDPTTGLACRLAVLIAVALTTMFALPAVAATANSPRFYARFEPFSDSQLYQMGEEYLNRRGMADSALVCFTVIANREEAGKTVGSDDRTYVNALNQMANIYSGYYNRFDLADECIDKAIARAKERRLDDRLPYLLGNKANVSYIYETLNGNKTAASRYARNLKEVFWNGVKAKEWSCVETAYYNMALHALNEGNVGEISRETKAFSQLTISGNDAKLGKARLYCRIVEEYGRGDYEQCKRLLIGAVPSATSSSNIYSTAMMRCELAMLYLKTNQPTEAYKQLDLTEQMADSNTSLTLKYSIYEIFTDFWRKTGNTVKAQQYDYKRLLIKEQLNQGNNLIGVKQQRFLRELDQVRDDLKTETQHRRTAAIVAITAGAALVVIGGLLVVLLRIYRRQSRYVDLLYQRVQRLLKSQQPLLPEEDDEEEETTKQKQLSLPDGIVESIDGVMRQTDVICSQDFSMAKLCDMTGYSRTYVSQAIRQQWGTNFAGLLNSCRIKEACNRMNDREHYGRFTIEAIAESLGYASRTNFAAVFKRTTGLSATEYIKRNRQATA